MVTDANPAFYRTHDKTLRFRPAPEADLERAARDFLVLDGWRALKTDPVSDRSRAKRFGERGMADYLYIRYGYGGRRGHAPSDALAELMWIEWKPSRAARRCTSSPGTRANRPAALWPSSPPIPGNHRGIPRLVPEERITTPHPAHRRRQAGVWQRSIQPCACSPAPVIRLRG
jgi:hypothetical protein